ncbi:MAG: hypothetical protein WCS96_10885 [Victivallales bacterium]
MRRKTRVAPQDDGCQGLFAIGCKYRKECRASHLVVVFISQFYVLSVCKFFRTFGIQRPTAAVAVFINKKLK